MNGEDVFEFYRLIINMIICFLLVVGAGIIVAAIVTMIEGGIDDE